MMSVGVISAGITANPLALAIALIGPWAMGWHLIWQMRRFDPENKASLTPLFQSNRDAGLIPVLFFAVALAV